MFDAICFEHCMRPGTPNEFNMYACTHDGCAWCALDKFVMNVQADTRFTRNLKRHIERLKQKKPHTRKIFVISE